MQHVKTRNQCGAYIVSRENNQRLITKTFLKDRQMKVFKLIFKLIYHQPFEQPSLHAWNHHVLYNKH